MQSFQSFAGKLITLDGIDGVGKSTQIESLLKFLLDRGLDVALVRDPGSTEVGQRLREILLDSDLVIHRRTEAMLFMASRCEMIESTIKPVLAAGKTVISDRFLLSTVVYQSVGGDVRPDLLWEMGKLANAGLQPDLTILLDMPASRSMARIDREADRMEARGLEYMESVRQAFLAELPNAGGEAMTINADQSAEAVFADIVTAISSL